MKIRSRNLNTATDTDQDMALKNQKPTSKYNLRNRKANALKENIPPQQHLGGKKKEGKNIEK